MLGGQHFDWGVLGGQFFDWHYNKCEIAWFRTDEQTMGHVNDNTLGVIARIIFCDQIYNNEESDSIETLTKLFSKMIVRPL